jgi:hypothetical protein
MKYMRERGNEGEEDENREMRQRESNQKKIQRSE